MSNESCADRSAVQEPEPGQTGDDYLLPDSIYLWVYGNPSTGQEMSMLIQLTEN
jgi:hypothetical protein